MHDWPPQLAECLSNGPIALFVGSGISVDAPSCLPNGDQLRDSIFDCLIAEQGLPERLILEAREATSRMRLEVFLNIFYEWRGSDESGSSLDFMLRAVPNRNHYYIAHLVRTKWIKHIVTTNFDCLIEAALGGHPVPVAVYCSDTDFEHLTVDASCQGIFKLHGSVLDGTGRSAMRTIKASITEIAAPTGEGVKKSNILRHILENHTVIFLGYSGRDEFDIHPAIYGSRPKQIIWVDHRSEDGVMILESYRDVLACEHYDNVSRLMMKHQHTMRLRCNTAIFLAQLSEYLSSHHIEESDGYDCIETRHPDRIKVALPPVQFLGYLFQYTHRWQSANETFDLALKDWSDRTSHSASDRKPIDEEIDIHSIAQICRGKGICYKEIGQSSLAHEYLQKAIVICEALYSERGTNSPITSIHQNHFIMMAQLCEDIALTYYSDKDYNAAFQWGTRAISWSRRIVLPKQRLFLARNFGNMGLILQDWALFGKDVTENSDSWKHGLSDADSSFKAAVSTESLCGNIVGLARSLHNWAYLSLLSTKWSEALQQGMTSLAYMYSLGGPFSKREFMRCQLIVIAALCALTKDIDEARRLLTKCDSGLEHMQLEGEYIDECIALYEKAQRKDSFLFLGGNSDLTSGLLGLGGDVRKADYMW